jgi:hypothetical protein
VSKAPAGKIYHLIPVQLCRRDIAKWHTTAGFACCLNLSTRWFMAEGNLRLVSQLTVHLGAG